MNPDVIVIGGGHAGIEAAYVCAKAGLKTILITLSKGKIGEMSCNVSIGGVGKGQVVKEIDALGGCMGIITDRSMTHFRMLNTSKGYAMWSPRAQCDRELYRENARILLMGMKNLYIIQDEVIDIDVKNSIVRGVKTVNDFFNTQVLILTTGTFLNGRIFRGKYSMDGGRIGERNSSRLSDFLKYAGFRLLRLKTGTPPRIWKKTIKFDRCIKQPADVPQPFSIYTTDIKNRILDCYITYTNKMTHRIILDNIKESSLYGGLISGVGPRYCPSIEDKVFKFREKERHQIFLEDEGYNSELVYPNGLSTSLPEELQERFIRSIEGLEDSEILRFGYAVEYDAIDSRHLKPTLESKDIKNLFIAGQINGTTGYEEAAGQGIVAGINAIAAIKGLPEFIPDRTNSYIGVMIDDLVTKGVDEPYRLFTSRAEYRILLRADNAYLRLFETGFEYGLHTKELYNKFVKFRDCVENYISGGRLDVSDEDIYPFRVQNIILEKKIYEHYKPYIEQQLEHIKKIKKYITLRIPENFDYNSLNLRKEAKEKFMKYKPCFLSQAMNIPGITPSDIFILLTSLRSRNTFLHLKEYIP